MTCVVQVVRPKKVKLCGATHGGFHKWGYPQIIHFNRSFHYKLFILGYPHVWKPPYVSSAMHGLDPFCMSISHPKVPGSTKQRHMASHGRPKALGRQADFAVQRPFLKKDWLPVTKTVDDTVKFKKFDRNVIMALSGKGLELRASKQPTSSMGRTMTCRSHSKIQREYIKDAEASGEERKPSNRSKHVKSEHKLVAGQTLTIELSTCAQTGVGGTIDQIRDIGQQCFHEIYFISGSYLGLVRSL